MVMILFMLTANDYSLEKRVPKTSECDECDDIVTCAISVISLWLLIIFLIDFLDMPLEKGEMFSVGLSTADENFPW